MLDQIDPDRPVPELRHAVPHARRRHARHGQRADVLGFRRRQGRSRPSPMRSTASPIPSSRRKIDAIIDMYREAAGAGRLPQLLVPAHAAGQALDQPARLPRALLRRPSDRGAPSPISRPPASASCSTSCAAMPTTSTAVFGRGAGQKRGYCGHEEIELALVRLGRVTGEQRYLDLAKLLRRRARRSSRTTSTRRRAARGADPAQFRHRTYEYNQSHLPVREQDKVVGHAVRAMYLYSGMADIATEYGDDSLTDALRGAVGRPHRPSRCTSPAASARRRATRASPTTTTCPTRPPMPRPAPRSALVFWASRMLGRGPDRRYADIMEQALYNGALAGPVDRRHARSSTTTRSKAAAAITAGPGTAAPAARRTSRRTVAVDRQLHVRRVGRRDRRPSLRREHGAADDRVDAGDAARRSTDYPWDGRVAITVGLRAPATLRPVAAHARLVPTARRCRSTAKRSTDVAVTADGYCRGSSANGGAATRIDLDLPMHVRALRANPDGQGRMLGRVALARGPLVYCVEEVDNGAGLNAHHPRRGRWRGADDERSPKLGGAVAVDLPVQRETWPATGAASSIARTPPTLEKADGAASCPIISGTTGQPGEMLVWVRRAAMSTQRPHARRRPAIELRDVRKSFGTVDVIHGIDLDDRGRRVRRLRRPVRLRQVHAAAHDRRARGRHRRRHPDRRPRRHRPRSRPSAASPWCSSPTRSTRI